MAEQGFGPGVVLGEARPAPALLCRQSVVLGVSNGAILIRPPPTRPARLRATMPPLSPQLLGSFRDLPLRNDLPPGEPLATPKVFLILRRHPDLLLCWREALCMDRVTCCSNPNSKRAVPATETGWYTDAFAGFDGAVMEFEEWVCLLLLDALQRAGFFVAAGQAHSLADMRAAVSADYSRFIAEAVNILVSAGMRLSRCLTVTRTSQEESSSA